MMITVPGVAGQAARLARVFTPEYALRINAQMVHPARSVVAKPTQLRTALVRPVDVSLNEPHRPASYLAASLSYGIIADRPFVDGNKRTALFMANEYLRVLGLPGITDTVLPVDGGIYGDVTQVVYQHVWAAASTSQLEELAAAIARKPQEQV